MRHARPGRLSRIVDLGARVAGGLATLCLVALIAVSAADVVLRQVGAGGVPGAVQYGEVLLVGLAFLGLASAQRREDHVAVDTVVRRLPGRVARRLQAVGYVAIVGLLGWLVWSSTAVALESVRQGEVKIGLVAIPLWPARIAVPVGSAVLAAVMLVQARRLVMRSGVGEAGGGEPGDGHVPGEPG